MAKQRTTTINIDYKVNTVDIERGDALLLRASKSTDDLRRATDNFNKQASAGYRFTSRSIEGMEIEVARLKQQVKLASTQNTADVKRLSDQYKSAKTQLDAYNRSLLSTARTSQQTAGATRGVASQFGALYSSIRLVLAAGLVTELVRMSINMAQLAGNTQAVKAAFTSQIPEATRILGELRKATLGTVDDLTLMQQALRAKNFGIAIERLPVLLEFARVRAQQTGQSVEYLANSIVDGLGRKSIRVLDNLQVSASRLREEFKGASLESLTVAQVTQGFANVVEDEMKKMGKGIENSATLVDQMKVAWVETKTEFADSGFWSYFINRLKDLAEGSTALIRLFKGESFDEQIRKRQIASAASIKANEFATKNLTKSREENIQVLEQELQRLTHELGLFAKRKDLAEKTIQLNGRLIRESPYGADTYALRENIDLQRKWIEAKLFDAEIDQETLRLLQDKLKALRAISKEEDNSGIIEKKKAEIQNLQALIEATQRAGDLGPNGSLILKLKKAQEDLAELLGQTKDDAKAAGEAIRDYLAALSDLAMFETNNQLKANQDRRKLEFENLKRSADLQEYFRELRLRKEQEAEDEAIRIAEDAAQQRMEIQQHLTDGIINTLQTMIDASLAARELELDAEYDHLQEKYSKQINLAGKNERKKRELEIEFEREREALDKRRAQLQKRRALTSIAIDTATNAVKLFAETVPPGILSAIAIAFGAVQAGLVSQQRFKDGVIDLKGPGTGTSDSIPARLSRGESVMTADETVASRGIFKAVRAKKLNDRVMKEIMASRGTVSGSFNDTNMVAKLDSIENELKLNRPIDIVERQGVLYKKQKKSERYAQFMRLNTMGK